jgi:hypothetical protein
VGLPVLKPGSVSALFCANTLMLCRSRAKRNKGSSRKIFFIVFIDLSFLRSWGSEQEISQISKQNHAREENSISKPEPV